MQNVRTIRTRFVAVVLLTALSSLAPARAHAANKEMIELQTQVQQLLDMVQRLQSTVDTRFGVLQHLIEQTADNSNKVTAAMDALQQRVAAQNEALSGKIDSNGGQVQSLGDSLEELKSRMSKLDKSIQDLQGQLQNVQNPGSGAPSAPGGGAGMQAPAQGPGAASGPGGGQAPPLQETYQAGVRDFNGARYAVAQGEFQDVVQYYPQDDLAGVAQFYLGEIAYHQQNYPDAVKAYNVVLEKFTTSSKAPAAQLHKGFALLQLDKRDAGIHELRSLIQKHPQSPEASQARTKLNGLGVRITTASR